MTKVTEPAAAPKQDAKARAEPGLDYLIARGNMGKTWFARWLWERANLGGRKLLLHDCDPGNDTLKQTMDLIEKDLVTSPENREPDTRVRFLKEAIACSQTSRVLVDPGASDRSAININGDKLSDEAQAALADEGWGEVTADFDLFAAVPRMNVWYFTGGDPADMTLLQEVLESSLSKKRIWIVLNEGVQRYPWSETRGLNIYKRALDAGAKEFLFPKCGADVPLRVIWGGKTFNEAIQGAPIFRPATRTQEPLTIDERQALRTFAATAALRVKESSMGSFLP